MYTRKSYVFQITLSLRNQYNTIFIIVLFSKYSKHLICIQTNAIAYVFRAFIAIQNLILMKGMKNIFHYVYVYEYTPICTHV